MELTITTFQRVAIIVTFVLYTLAVVGVAVYARWQKSSVNSYVDDFYTGGRGMGMLAVAFMIAAGLCGAGTFVGSPGMSYRVGGPWLMINGCQLLSPLWSWVKSAKRSVSLPAVSTHSPIWI